MDTEQFIRDYLAQVVHMSLATSANNQPWVCEVHFAYDDDLNLYWRSKSNRRHSQEIAANPHVAGNIIRQHGLKNSPVGVYFEGTAELLPAGIEQTKAFEALRDREIAKPDALEEAGRQNGHQFYKIIIKNWYAFGPFGENGSSTKVQLIWNGSKK